MEAFSLSPIGNIKTPFVEKFGIPRQPGLCLHANGVVTLPPTQDSRDGVIGLDQFNYVWLLYCFHQIPEEREKYAVRPPRLSERKKMGVWATRSPHRPNRIGMSLVKLERIENDKTGVRLHLSGVDLLDGTPILDIKPYIHYSDSRKDSQQGWIEKLEDQQLMSVGFTAEVDRVLLDCDSNLKNLLLEILAQDPRPRHQRIEEKSFSFGLGHFDITFRGNSDQILVTGIIEN